MHCLHRTKDKRTEWGRLGGAGEDGYVQQLIANGDPQNQASFQ